MSSDRSTMAPQIVEEASDWFVQMREPAVSAEDQVAFTQWLRASPVHVGAYLEIARMWGDAAHLPPDIDLTATRPSNILPLRVAEAARTAGPIDHSNRRTPRRVAIATSLFALCVAATGTWWYADRGSATYASDIGEQRLITLADGSTVKLDSRSRLSVRLTRQVREIELLAGQALFDVAHDSKRPFIVRTGDVFIRAVGTQFDVNRRLSGTVVTVVEGRVRLGMSGQDTTSVISDSAVTTDGASAVLLSAGEQVKIARTGGIDPPAKANTAAATSWVQQELVFDGLPLSDVIEEFNRYSRIPLVLTDTSLGTLRVNAVFHTTNPDSLLRFVSRLQNVRIERSEQEIRISKQ
jgi:transmembrane sensor